MSDDDVPASKRRKVGAHISPAQKTRLHALMQENNKLRCGKLSATFTLKDAAKAWQNIADQLNAIPGASKDWKAWRKTWQDIYSKVKAKTAQINRSQRQTGGGPPTAPLTQFEESVSALINPRVVSGHQESQESTVDFDFSQFDNTETSGEETLIVYQIADDRENTNALSQPQVPPRRTKINMKSLLKDKVEIKRKYYEEKLLIMKQKNNILQEINNNLVHLCDSFNRSTQH